MCSGKQSKDWDIWELEAKDGYLELKQPLWKLKEIILECLRKCESFKGNENELYFEEHDAYLEEREPRFSIFMIERESIIIILHIV